MSIALMLPAVALAVSQKEMEQARTIAAKAYLRYANDGSGYLDDINPLTMEELESALKPKEKENIKAFMNIPVPADYKGWDKEKLVEYWAVTAFQDKGLLEKGRGGRIRARSLINKMTVSPPAPEPVASQQPLDTTSSSPVSTPEVNALEDNAEEEFPDINVEKADNYTWVYIMILGILVVIVVILIVYAANVFKKTGDTNSYGSDSSHNMEEDEEKEKYEALLADRNVEISMLHKKLETADRQNSELRSRIDSLLAEIAMLKSSYPSIKAPEREDDPKIENVQEKVSLERKLPLRSIYLGRANSKGIFVRADRSLNIGHSIYILETGDGFSGTFRVADSPASWSLALSNPTEYLSTACAGYNLEDTAGVVKIITESSGTAVFEGGCWRVIRKAKIRYER